LTQSHVSISGLNLDDPGPLTIKTAGGITQLEVLKDVARAIHNLGPAEDERLDAAFDLVGRLLAGLHNRISIFELVAHPFLRDLIHKRCKMIVEGPIGRIVGRSELTGEEIELPRISVRAGKEGLLEEPLIVATTVLCAADTKWKLGRTDPGVRERSNKSDDERRKLQLGRKGGAGAVYYWAGCSDDYELDSKVREGLFPSKETYGTGQRRAAFKAYGREKDKKVIHVVSPDLKNLPGVEKLTEQQAIKELADSYHAVFEVFAMLEDRYDCCKFETLRIAPLASEYNAGKFRNSMTSLTAKGLKEALRRLSTNSTDLRDRLCRKNIELWIFTGVKALAVEADLPWRSALEIEGIYRDTPRSIDLSPVGGDAPLRMDAFLGSPLPSAPPPAAVEATSAKSDETKAKPYPASGEQPTEDAVTKELDERVDTNEAQID
jgi:hypothetical protein